MGKEGETCPSSAPVCALGHLPPKGKAYGQCGIFRGGRVRDPPLQCILRRARWFGDGRRRRETAPAPILEKPGPSGPAGIQTGHSDFARRKFSADFQVRVPRNGGPGVSRHWRTKFASAASPGDPLGAFPSLGKYLAARRRRNSPHKPERGGGGKPPPYKILLTTFVS